MRPDSGLSGGKARWRERASSEKGGAWLTSLVLLSGLLLLLALVVGMRSLAPPVHHRHVLVISVDGMRAQDYMTPPPGAQIPNILRLKRGGSYAEAVEGVYPSVTYPSHTTIVTGCFPAQHGIYTNNSSRVAGKNVNDWFWFAKAIKCPTLWDEARRHGMTTASVAWPVTAGAAIDWDVPEIWDPSKPPAAEPLYVARFMNPVFAFEIFTALGAPKAGERNDDLRTKLAVYILTKHKPDLTLVHLIDLDQTEHAFGPGSPEAVATLNRSDRRIGAILGAVKEAGFAGRTDVFIVSDHGFMTVDRRIHPNTLLVKAGLMTANENGTITGGKIDTVANGGSFFIYWPRNENLRPAIDHALKPLLDRKLVWAILGPQALREMGADPGARLALEAPRHAMFDLAGRGALVSGQSGGEHGYLPFRKGLAASFIAWGPDIKPGVDLHEIPMTAVGPTILKAMGIADPKFGDHPPLNDIWKAR